MIGAAVGFVAGVVFGVFMIALMTAGTMKMNGERGICRDCEYYAEYKGEMECWNRDSDKMYERTLPEDSCGEFEERRERN